MNILLLGSGGREHALAWKIAQSPLCEKLFIAPGNTGTEQCGVNVLIDITDNDAVQNFMTHNSIDMLIIGPEAPLANGLVDAIRESFDFDTVHIIGPSAEGAELESSKDFANQFMDLHNIPTAKNRAFNANQVDTVREYIESRDLPIVVKADGLAAGKGVTIYDTHQEAIAGVHELFNGKFGDAGKTVIIEDFLKGTELSVFVLYDDANYMVLPTSKDYKRATEGDTGPNTGGMGAISPAPSENPEFMDKVISRVIKPTLNGLQREGIRYCGIIYFGLMDVDGDPYVIEYNVRFGDPEAQVVLPRIENDIVELFRAMGNQELDQQVLKISKQHAATVVATAAGYPGTYNKGDQIRIQNLGTNPSLLFHAGIKKDETGRLLTNGGRVLALTNMADTTAEALGKCYGTLLDKINFNGMHFRRDIGYEVLEQKSA